jgi:hypothetical protein
MSIIHIGWVPHPCDFLRVRFLNFSAVFLSTFHNNFQTSAPNQSYIFSGASIPNKSSALTSCVSTSSVIRSRNARFCSSASDKM